MAKFVELPKYRVHVKIRMAKVIMGNTERSQLRSAAKTSHMSQQAFQAATFPMVLQAMPAPQEQHDVYHWCTQAAGMVCTSTASSRQARPLALK